MGNVYSSSLLNEPFPDRLLSTVELGTRKETSFRRIREWNLLDSVISSVLGSPLLPLQISLLHNSKWRGRYSRVGTYLWEQPGWEQLLLSWVGIVGIRRLREIMLSSFWKVLSLLSLVAKCLLSWPNSMLSLSGLHLFSPHP